MDEELPSYCGATMDNLCSWSLFDAKYYLRYELFLLSRERACIDVDLSCFSTVLYNVIYTSGLRAAFVGVPDCICVGVYIV